MIDPDAAAHDSEHEASDVRAIHIVGEHPGSDGEAESTTGSTGDKAVTQQRILQAAMQLFSEGGYDRTSISQIATRSGVSRATIFWHFGNKATLFQETCRHFLVPFRASLERSLVHLEPRARVVDQLTAYERFVSDNRATIHSFVGWVFSTSSEPASWLRGELLALHAAYEKSIERALTDLIDDPAEAAHLATAVVSILHGNMLLELGNAAGCENRSRTLHALLDRAFERAGIRSR